MATQLNMPQMGYDMEEGTVIRWLAEEGAEVALGDAIAEIETDKAVVEFESTTAGVLRQILVPEGATVPVGQAIAVVGGADEDLSSADSPSEDTAEPAADMEMEEPPAEDPAGERDTETQEEEKEPAMISDQLRASPVARRLAEEQGIDLALIRGTGPGGRITRDDVLSFVPEPEEEPVEEPAVEMEDETAEEPAAEVVEEPVEEPVAEVVEEPVEEPAAEPEEEISEVPTAKVVEETAEVPASEIVEEPVEEPTAEPEEEPVEEPVAEIVEDPATEAEEETFEEPVAEPEVEEDAGEMEPLTRMRQQIARVTVRSKQEIPHYYVSAEIDMTEAMSLRKQINKSLGGEGVRVTVNDLVIKACVGALALHPKFNASFSDDGVQMNPDVNIGIAIAQAEGLIVPAIMDCGDKGLREIAAASKDLIERATNGTLSSQEYTGGTFSISNMGMFDIASFTAIILPPQSAMLAVGSVAERAVARDGRIEIANMMNATLSADHRVSDGAEGARLILEIKRRLENPLSLVV